MVDTGKNIYSKPAFLYSVTMFAHIQTTFRYYIKTLVLMG